MNPQDRIASLSAERDGSRSAVYAPSMEQSDSVQQLLHAELPRALAGAPGLAIHLQPQIDLTDGACRACEALLRWQLPSGQLISPAQTLAVVERFGLRGNFTRWLLLQAMQVQTRLRAEGIALVLSINLSANDLLDAELPELIEQVLRLRDDGTRPRRSSSAMREGGFFVACGCDRVQCRAAAPSALASRRWCRAGCVSR